MLLLVCKTQFVLFSLFYCYYLDLASILKHNRIVNMDLFGVYICICAPLVCSAEDTVVSTAVNCKIQPIICTTGRHTGYPEIKSHLWSKRGICSGKSIDIDI